MKLQPKWKEKRSLDKKVVLLERVGNKLLRLFSHKFPHLFAGTENLGFYGSWGNVQFFSNGSGRHVVEKIHVVNFEAGGGKEPHSALHDA